MSFFSTLFAWLSTFWGWVETAFTWILDGIVLVLQFIFFTIFDGILSVVEGLFSTLDLSSLMFDYAAAWTGLPSQLIWLIHSVALPECLAILATAYGIRLFLNLIPSWATRV